MKKSRPLKTQHRLALVITLFTLIPMTVLGGIYLSSLRRATREAVLSEHAGSLSAVAGAAEDVLERTLQKTRYILSNRTIATFLFQETPHGLVNTLTFVEYYQEMMSALSADGDDAVIRFYSFGIQTNMGDYLYTEAALRADLADDEALLTEILSAPADTVHWRVRPAERRSWRRDAVLSLCMYQKLDLLSRTVGVISFDIPLVSLLQGVPDDLPEGAQLVLLSGTGADAICVDAQNPQAAESTPQVRDYLASGAVDGFTALVHRLKTGDMQLLLLLPSGYIAAKVWPGYAVYIALYLLVIALVVVSTELASYLFQRRTIAAIDDMSREIDGILGGKAMDANDRRDDIARVRERTYALINETKDAYEKIKEVSEDKARLELELLQLRFNPHFLYNTLGSIRSLSRDREVRGTIDSMIAYYRIVLNQGAPIIAIEDELRLISEYIGIQRFAYKMDFALEMDVPPEVRARRIVKHLLQPVVENALFHGVRTAQTDASLRLAARMQDGDIVFTVADNGMGMTPERIARLLEKPEASQRGGYGMYNVVRRIQVYYGPAYGLAVTSTPGEGTCVTLRIRAELPEEAGPPA